MPLPLAEQFKVTLKNITNIITFGRKWLLCFSYPCYLLMCSRVYLQTFNAWFETKGNIKPPFFQISVNLSTIEKRFDLSSTKSSFIINAYDISCAATVMFISHFCKNSKPKWIGIGIVVMGIGALIFTIPHVAET